MLVRKNAFNQTAAIMLDGPPRPTNESARVLVVDDDPHLLAALRRGLSLRGFEVGLAKDAGEASGYLEREWPDLVVLDIMMPGTDGLSFCGTIRQRSNIPILMLTARDTVPDRVAGFYAGADDYVVKPFALEELVARMRALLRRARPDNERDGQLSYADLTLERASWTAARGGQPLSLTAKEFAILELFLRNPALMLTREAILVAIWGADSPTESNVVDVHVTHLRRKLEAGGRPRLIRTVRGVGYMLRER